MDRNGPLCKLDLGPGPTVKKKDWMPPSPALYMVMVGDIYIYTHTHTCIYTYSVQSIFYVLNKMAQLKPVTQSIYIYNIYKLAFTHCSYLSTRKDGCKHISPTLVKGQLISKLNSKTVPVLSSLDSSLMFL